jgi:hypothetical protein
MNPIPKLADKGAAFFINLARQLEPLYRDQFDQKLRAPIEAITQGLIRLRLKNQGLKIAEEKTQLNEEKNTKSISKVMSRFLEKEYRETGKTAERAGNTKTYGLVKAVFTVNPDLPKSLQTGLFKAGQQYPTYIRFGGPGPRVVPDTKDNGILSIGIKLMGVPGKKLLDDEKFTVDFSGISSPSFTTPNVQENIKLQEQIGKGTPAWYFLNPFDSHYLDMIMQGLYARLHANPLELNYYSCVPYLYGKQNGQHRAIKFAIIPRITTVSSIDKLSDNYLRGAMIKTLSHHSVVLDFAIQFQTDSVYMPIEDASVVWSEKKSPFIKIASIEIPKQVFTNPSQDKFARNLTINPWHTLATHRPLGNQNRARKTIYQITSRVRQSINAEKHIEPHGDEVFTIQGMKKTPPEMNSKKQNRAKNYTRKIKVKRAEHLA